MEELDTLDVTTAGIDPHDLLVLVEKQSDQVLAARKILLKCVVAAERRKPLADNYCVTLCSFVSQLTRSSSATLRDWTFSHDVGVALFDFFLEWNENGQHRSVKMVLEQIAIIITQNPKNEVSDGMKAAMLDTALSIISGMSTKPLVKSAMRIVDHYLAKEVFVPDEIWVAYNRLHGFNPLVDDLEIWRRLMLNLFHWMKLPYLCAAAGRFVVTLYRLLLHRPGSAAGIQQVTPSLWHQWMLEALSSDLTLLGGIQNYIYPSLFKSHRPDGLGYLKAIISKEITQSGQVNAASLLQLAALKVGKQQGLVGEPGAEEDVKKGKEKGGATSIPLDANVINQFVYHASHEARFMALSLIISSAATTKPFSADALSSLRACLEAFLTDADAKFRVDVMALIKEMLIRLSGAIASLHKSVNQLQSKHDEREDEMSVQMQQQTGNTFVGEPDNLEQHLGRQLEEQKGFLSWYLKFLLQGLVPTASYQRHITALKSLVLLLKLETSTHKFWETGGASFFYDVFDKTWRRALLDLVVDPFDDVRTTSCLALELLFSEKRFAKFRQTSHGDGSSRPAEFLRAFLTSADGVSTLTARADHADGVSRTCRLLYDHLEEEHEKMGLVGHLIESLEQKIALAELDLGRAVLDAPVHGAFAALCQVWQAISVDDCTDPTIAWLEGQSDKIISYCRRIWLTVESTLCDDSPEGHLPQDLEDTEGLGTKELLSFSFRAIHESSNLLKMMLLGAKRGPVAKKHGVSLSFEAVKIIGGLSFEQLSTLRHRGALTTVALTFATHCQVASSIQGPDNEEEKEDLLETWHKEALKCIHELNSTTRRSAGIPSIMIGILSANAKRPSFDTIMTTLIEIAQVDVHVFGRANNHSPQVHAHNCLQGIFKSSVLTLQGNQSEHYLSPCLRLAANSLKSKVWSIRNCGLILIRSLIDSLFNKPESKLAIEAGWDGRTTRIVYHKCPELSNVLIRLLQVDRRIADSQETESVFPALDIIRRAGPPDTMRERLQQLIVVHLASPVWHVREMAARALCSCILRKRWLEIIENQLMSAIGKESGDRDVDGYKQNHLHGTYLALKFMIEKMANLMPEQIIENWRRLTALFRKLDNVWPNAFNSCPDILAAHLEVINLLLSPQLAAVLPVNHVDASVFIPKRDLRNLRDLTALQEASPLLRTQIAKLTIHQAARSRNIMALRESVREACVENAAVAETMLEAISAVWIPMASLRAPEVSQIFEIHVDVCMLSRDGGTRTFALERLADLLDMLLLSGMQRLFPEKGPLVELWHRLRSGPISPGLSNAIIKCSGAIIAVIGGKDSDIYNSPDISAWGTMVASAGQYDKDFDTRLAAVTSLKYVLSALPISSSAYPSLLSNISPTSPPAPALLPAILALYDALNDDDDEIRNIAASAASGLFNGRLQVPIEASAWLLKWMSGHFAHRPEFRAEVLARVVHGQANYNSGQITATAATAGREARQDTWEPARTQLERAKAGGGELFAVEKSNLFVDEVREARRWTAALVAIYSANEAVPSLDVDPDLRALRNWTATGVADTLDMVRVRGGDGGPLGWTSRPAVFAVCARVVVAASAVSRLAQSSRAPGVTRSWIGADDEGRSSELSELLLVETAIAEDH